MFSSGDRREGLFHRSVSKTLVDIEGPRLDEGLRLRPAVASPANFQNQPCQEHRHGKEKDSDDEDDGKDSDSSADENAARQRRRQRLFYSEMSGYLVLCIIVAAVVIVIFRANKNQMHELSDKHGHDSKTPKKSDIWWHNALVYNIYPRSFQDSNGDGIGDLNGILERMPHLLGIGAEVIMLNSIHKAPPSGSDRGISDFMAVDPLLGTLEDFSNFIKQLHDRGLYLIIEFIINHTSDRHRWFQESRKGGADNKYANYYVWHPGKVLKNGTRLPPNNWLSRYGGSIWTWDDMRGEFYLHQYGSGMPDLNHRSTEVRQEFMEIFHTWLERGIDGIYLEGVQAIFEVDDLEDLDEPTSDKPGVAPGEWLYLDHVYTDDQPEIHEFLATWREQLDHYMHDTKRKIFLGVEVMDDRIADVLYYYQTGADAPLSLILADFATDCNGYCIHETIDRWLIEVPDGRTSFWAASNHEVGRLASRKGPMYKGVLAMLQLLLPGGAVIFYGDEIGMEHHEMSPSDVISGEHFTHRAHNGSRTPMQWDASKNAGFSTANVTWLPVHKDYRTVNVEVQLSGAKAGHSRTTLQLYRRLIRLRSEVAFTHGRMEFIHTTPEIFSFTRFARDEHSYFIVLNVGQMESTEDYFRLLGLEQARVMCHMTGSSSREVLREDDLVNVSPLTLAPGEGMVLQLF